MANQNNNKTIIISRVFDAPRELVWQAYTNPEMMKTWWGPKDFTAPVIKSDFRVDGKYLYCMHGPKGTEFDKDFWSAGTFEEIIPMEKIVATDHFSDENGSTEDPAKFGMSPDFPKETVVTVRFEETANQATNLVIEYPPPASDAEYRALIESGMEDGWNESLDKLAATIAAARKKAA